MYKRWIEIIRDLVKEDRKYILTFIFSQIFPWSFFIFNNSKSTSMMYALSEFIKASETLFGIFGIFILVALIVKYLFRNKYKKILLFLIILNFIGNTLDMLIYLNFGTQISPEMLNILFESNKNEASEFLSFYLNKNILFVGVYYLIGILMLFKIKKHIFIKSLIISVLVLIIGINILDIQGSTYFRKTYIYKNISRSYSRYKKAIKETNRIMATFDERFKNTKVLDNVDEGTYVLIIGESFSKYHSSLYGYPRDTSPNLKKRYDQGEIIKFDNVVSPHHFTRDTLLKLVTDYSYDSKQSFAESMNIIDLFKKAGYKTFWLSNQEDFIYNGAGLSSVVNRADEVIFTEKSMSDAKIKLDDSSLLPFINQALNDSSKKKFIVVHLFGSHMDYKHRYPKEFEYFNLSLEEEYFTKLQKENKKIVNEYHNAIRFSDYLVNEVISLTEKTSENSYVFYLSDHGQIVYDDNTKYVGNTLPTLNIKAVEIPMLVWISKSYRELNKNKIEFMKKVRDKKFSSENIIYSLINLSNFKYDGYDSKKDLFNEDFEEKDRQISSEGLIYEELKKEV